VTLPPSATAFRESPSYCRSCKCLELPPPAEIGVVLPISERSRKKMYRLRLLLLLGFVVGAFQFASAGCWDYVDPGPGMCTGAVGCRGTYPRTLCSFGCISGGCNSSGNSAECCGVEHHYAAGWDDGSGDCRNDACGAIRVGLHAKHQGPKSRALTADSNEPTLVYRPPRILLVPSKCTHVYEPLFDQSSSVVSKQGM
jgi:hypothetical protein